MALLWMDGFEGYGAVGDPVNVDNMALRYELASFTSSVLSGSSIVAGAFGGRQLAVYGSANGNTLTTPFIGSTSEVYIGLRIKLEALPLSNHKFIAFQDQTGTEKCYLQITTTGALQITSATGGHGFSGTSATTLSTGTYYYLEVYIKFHASAGEYNIKLDGSSVKSQTGIDTIITGGTTTWGAILIDAPILSSSSKWYWDDLYILDETGSTNNTFLGDVRVIGLFPDEDVAGSSDFTPSSGTDHYALVNHPNADPNTYVEGDVGDVELFKHTDLTASGTIYGVRQTIDIMKSEPDSPDVKLRCDSGATSDSSSAEAVSAGVFKHARIYETDPNTGSAWTKTNLNAAKFGVEGA